MSIKQALQYPVQNLQKIAILSLGYIVILAIVIETSTHVDITMDDPNLVALVYALIFMGLILGFMLFSLGYGMHMIRHIQHGDVKMPQIKPLRDLARGISIGFAGFITFLPLLFFFMIFSRYLNRQYPTLNFMLLVIMFLMGSYLLCGLIVGIKQYAQYSKVSCLFDFQFNFEIVHKNRLQFLQLIGYFVIISSIYILSWSLLQTAINHIFSPSVFNGLIAVTFYLIYLSILCHLMAQCSDVTEKIKSKRTTQDSEHILHI